MSYDHEDDGYISTQLDYSRKTFAHSTLRHTRLLPLAGTTSVTITPAGLSQTLIEIPTKCFNLAQSFLCWNIDPAQAATTVCLPTDMVSYIQSIRLYTRSGAYLCDLQFAKNHTAIIRPLKTKMSDYLTQDIGELLAPQSKCPVGAAASVRGPVQNATYAAAANGRANGQALSDPTLEPCHVATGTNNNAADNPTIQVQLPLSAFKNTILAYDKLLWLPEVVVLEINWAAGAQAAWIMTNGTNPSTGAAALATNLTYAGIALYLAVEQDTMIQTKLIERVNSGTFSCLIPYTYLYKVSTSGTGSLSWRLNRGMGLVLQEIVFSLWDPTESGNTLAASQNNQANPNVQNYYTMLDGNRLQDQNVNTQIMAAGAATSAVNEDYLINKRYMKGTVYSNLDFYRYRWFHMDSFSDDRSDNVCPPGIKDNLVRGLPLTLERKWDMQATTGQAGPYNFYVYAKTCKLLSVGAMGITVA